MKAIPILLCLGACHPGTVRSVEYPNGKAEIYLSGETADAFRNLVGHGALTPSENIIIYGTEEPPTLRLKCHEAKHQYDAKLIADWLISQGLLRDNDLDRWLAYIAIYAINARSGYKDNLMEERARDECKNVIDK